jgi:hypothetical protein
MRLRKIGVAFGIVLASIPPLSALTWGYRGLVTVWLFDNFERSLDTQLGGRFIPEFTQPRVSSSLTLDAEFPSTAGRLSSVPAGIS